MRRLIYYRRSEITPLKKDCEGDAFPKFLNLTLLQIFLAFILQEPNSFTLAATINIKWNPEDSDDSIFLTEN